MIVYGGHSCPPPARQSGAFGSSQQRKSEAAPPFAFFEEPALSEVEGVGTMQPEAPPFDVAGRRC